jgi:hypothetical protein
MENKEMETETKNTITAEEIEARKAKALAEYAAKKQIIQAKADGIKAGVKYLHDRGLPLYQFDYQYWRDKDGYQIFMTWETKGNQTLFAFAFCSPNDNASDKTAKGLLGQRLQNKKHTILCETIPRLRDGEIALLGRSLLTVAALEGTNIPDCIQREVRLFCGETSYNGAVNCLCARKPLERLPG